MKPDSQYSSPSSNINSTRALSTAPETANLSSARPRINLHTSFHKAGYKKGTRNHAARRNPVTRNVSRCRNAWKSVNKSKLTLGFVSIHPRAALATPISCSSPWSKPREAFPGDNNAELLSGDGIHRRCRARVAEKSWEIADFRARGLCLTTDGLPSPAGAFQSEAARFQEAARLPFPSGSACVRRETSIFSRVAEARRAETGYGGSEKDRARSRLSNAPVGVDPVDPPNETRENFTVARPPCTLPVGFPIETEHLAGFHGDSRIWSGS